MKAKVVSGSGEGAKYVEVYADKIRRAVNMQPYPGTLNLEVSQDLPPLETVIIEGFGKFGEIELAPCAVNQERAFIVFPSKGEQRENVIELISGKNLKALLGLEDGDFVHIQF